MKTNHKTFLTILLLITVSSAALAYMETSGPAAGSTAANPSAANPAPLAINASLPQEKVLRGGPGRVSVALTLNGADLEILNTEGKPPVDLVVVLDRSGSMGGRKINDARNAVIQLINRMEETDRMAIIAYANDAEMISPLVSLDIGQRKQMVRQVQRIAPGGGTNLGTGLQTGIEALLNTPSDMHQTRQRKVILVSDGLANQGITSPQVLGRMAAIATERNLGISTVGVGYDFNEVLMTTIADHGSGSYYFLDNPGAFASVFSKELETTRMVAAGSIELRIVLEDGVQLLDAGGYPIRMAGNVAIIRPGDLLAGQQRRLFLTYQIPTDLEQSYALGTIQASYLHNGARYSVTHPKPLQVACVADREEVIGSIDKDSWSQQVIKEDYSKLKDTVAKAFRSGRKEEALKAIEEYKTRTDEINRSVDSAVVSQNLEEEVADLQKSVRETFAGAPAAVAEKQKQQAKKLQFDSYRIRRDK